MTLAPRDDLRIRYAVLGDVLVSVISIGPEGTAGSSLEEPCDAPHWAIVLRGDIVLEQGGREYPIGANHAFHVPAGAPPHRFRAASGVRIVGFQPVDPVFDAGDEGLGVSDRTTSQRGTRFAGAPVVEPLRTRLHLDPGVREGSITARSVEMGGWAMTEAVFGRRSGFLGGWCDVPHWGLLVDGELTLEWEADVELVAAGDLMYCPPGPPGHRLEVAESAFVVDFTSLSALSRARRVGDWRPKPPFDAALAGEDRAPG